MSREELAEKYGVDKEDVTCGKCKFGLVIVAGPPKFIHCDKRHTSGSDIWCKSYEYKWGKEK